MNAQQLKQNVLALLQRNTRRAHEVSELAIDLSVPAQRMIVPPAAVIVALTELVQEGKAVQVEEHGETAYEAVAA